MAQGVILNDTLYNALKAWINKYYRDRLAPADLADPLLYEENSRALNALMRILRLGPFPGLPSVTLG
jgi:succinylarginine dihydrolase